ncbi:MAG TPA: CU044_2847 family protein [Verrucomicrobiae bacterium]|jgi:hypothetical protein
MPTIAFDLEPQKPKGRKNKKNESVILVECSGPGNVPRNASGASVEKIAEDMEKHLKPLSKLGNMIRESLTDTLTDINNPAKIEVEFGLELKAEAGFMKILAGSSTANFKVTLTWENKKEVANAKVLQ